MADVCQEMIISPQLSCSTPMNNFSDPNFSVNPPPVTDRMGLTWLVGAAVATVFIWQVPFGNLILYPFTILATWFHEMGHGLTALLLGGEFDRLLIFANGSGLAFHRGGFLGPIGHAIVAAGGPMGPAIAGAALILLSRRFQTAHYGLIALGAALLLSTLLWVRSLFGLVAIPVLGLVILAIALRSPRWVQGFAIQLLGVQACISTFEQIDYLFTYQANVGGQVSLSDSAQIAQVLLLPHWFWGGLMAIGSLLLLVQSLRMAYGTK